MDIFGLANSFSHASAGDIFRNFMGGRFDAGGARADGILGGVFSGLEGFLGGNLGPDRLSLPGGIPSTMDLLAGGRGRGGGGGTGGLRPDDEDLPDPTWLAGGRGGGGGGTGGLRPDDEDLPDPTRLAGGRGGGGGGTYGQAEPVPIPETMYA